MDSGLVNLLSQKVFPFCHTFNIIKSIECGYQIDVIVIDFKKSLGTVNHALLINALKVLDLTSQN